jgi:hypothetical protein
MIFHSALPVSGLVKGLGGPKLANWGLLHDFLARPKPLVAAVAILLILELTAWRADKRTTLLCRSIAVLTIAVAVQACYYAALSTWPIWLWYLYLRALLFSVVMARSVHLVLRLFEALTMQAIACLAMVGAVLAVALLTDGETRDYFYRLYLLLSLSKREHQLALPTSELSFNVVSVDMINTFFADKPKIQVAMGDRAGGLAYWGRPKITVVQAEGLTLDSRYVAARTSGTAEEYFASNFNIAYWIVDREVVPLVRRHDGASEFVVADPIQGRITLEPVPTFCFPEQALLYRLTYGVKAFRSTRFVFSFPERQPCSRESMALIFESLSGEGLRQLSLPSEYDLSNGGFKSKASEDRDRTFARTLRSASSPNTSEH